MGSHFRSGGHSDFRFSRFNLGCDSDGMSHSGIPRKRIMKMNATEVARKYHETWNGRAADALVGAFTKDGTFCNPDTYPGIRGEALAAFVKGVWTAIPDFSIEMLNAGEIEPGLVAHHGLIQAAELRPSRVIRTSPTGALQCDVGGGRI